MQQNDNHAQLWQILCQQSAASYKKILEEGELVIQQRIMRFVYKIKGNKPPNGYSLIFGFHGGGGCPPQVNNQQYQNHINLYKKFLPEGSIWFVPRSIEDLSDMWWKEYLEDFLLCIVRAFTLNGLVDVNKVFLTGYSAGGDGIYHMAPRMADYLAGAAMMAGHPNSVDLINLRNITFSIQVGAQDKAYSRNQQARKYIKSLNALQEIYGGYKHYSNVRNGVGHWMNYGQVEIFNLLFRQVRNPYPNVVIFKQHPRRTKKWMYYIKVDQRDNKDEVVFVWKKGNKFSIESQSIVSIYLNRNMIDQAQPIIVEHNKHMTFHTMFTPKNQTAKETLYERMDPYYIFDDVLISVPGIGCNEGRLYN